MIYQQKLRFSTKGRGTYNISDQIQDCVNKSEVKSGICTLFIQHTSASIIMCENADKTVREDIETYMAKLVKDGDSMFKHKDEGPDDMAAHMRTILTQGSLSIPIYKGKCDLGIWQGIFLWEHRTNYHKRNVSVTIMGE